MKVVIELTKPQADALREAIRYYMDEQVQSGMRDQVAERVYDKVLTALDGHS